MIFTFLLWVCTVCWIIIEIYGTFKWVRTKKFHIIFHNVTAKSYEQRNEKRIRDSHSVANFTDIFQLHEKKKSWGHLFSSGYTH